MVGLIPLFAVETLDSRVVDIAAGFKRRMQWFIENRPELAEFSKPYRKMETCNDFLSLGIIRNRLPRVFALHAGRKRISLAMEFDLFRAFTKTSPYVILNFEATNTGSITSRRIVHGPFWRQLQLARSDLVPGQFPDH